MIEAAAAYVKSNVELKQALHIDANAQLALHPLGQGEHNQNFWFADPATNAKYVLRINVLPQPFHDDQVSYEHAALTALADSGRAPLPLYIDNSPSAPGKGVLVISFCKGEQLDFDHLRPGDLRCAAQLMADVHAVAAPNDCILHRPADPLRGLFNECITRYKVYLGSAYEDPRLTKWVDRFIAAAEPMLLTQPAPGDCEHIVNSETLPSHFLIPAASAHEAATTTATSGPFCAQPGAFIDWERPIIGEVAQDVAYFTSPTTSYWDSEFMFPASDVDMVLNDYWRAVNGRFEMGNFEERFRAFRMMTALRSTCWCVKALIQYNDPSAYTTEKTRRKLPIYLSDDFMAYIAHDCFGL